MKDSFVKLKHPDWREISKYQALRKSFSVPLFTSEARNRRDERLHLRSISRLVKEAMRAVNINSPRLTAHSLRHTAITACKAAGESDENAMMMSGYVNTDTLRKYSHLRDRMIADPEGSTAAYYGWPA